MQREYSHQFAKEYEAVVISGSIVCLSSLALTFWQEAAMMLPANVIAYVEILVAYANTSHQSSCFVVTLGPSFTKVNFRVHLEHLAAHGIVLFIQSRRRKVPGRYDLNTISL